MKVTGSALLDTRRTSVIFARDARIRASELGRELLVGRLLPSSSSKACHNAGELGSSEYSSSKYHGQLGLKEDDTREDKDTGAQLFVQRASLTGIPG